MDCKELSIPDTGSISSFALTLLLYQLCIRLLSDIDVDGSYPFVTILINFVASSWFLIAYGIP